MATRDELRGHKGGNNRYDDVEVEEEELLDEDDEMLMTTPSKHSLVGEGIEDGEGEEEGEYQNNGGEEEEYEENDNLSENELNILQQLEEHEANGDNYEYGEGEEFNNEEKGKGRIYQHKLCKPVLQVGNTKIGLSHAKLFGLADHTGKVTIDSSAQGGVDRNNQRKKFLNMSKPREIDPNLIEQATEAPSFKPSRTKEAMQAMMNNKCGYDFVNRMKEDKTGFLERVSRDTVKKGNLSKAELDQLEADYAIRQDKLQCPQCRKPQSFDEFIEKKRVCSQCAKKFERLNVTSGQNFAAKAKEKEAERRAKLREKEIAMYGENSVSYALPRTKPVAAPPLPPPDKNAANSKFIRENIKKIAQAQAAKRADTVLPPIGDQDRGGEEGEGIAYGARSKKSNSSSSSSGKVTNDPDRLLLNKQQGSLPWVNAVEKMAAQNNAHADLLNATLLNLQEQYGAYVEDGPPPGKGRPPKGGASSGGRPKSAAAATAGAGGGAKSGRGGSAGAPKDKTTAKFEKLLDVDDTYE